MYLPAYHFTYKLYSKKKEIKCIFSPNFLLALIGGDTSAFMLFLKCFELDITTSQYSMYVGNSKKHVKTT